MMKTKIYCLLGLLVVGSGRADTGATSKYYVDSELAQKEALIPAKSVDTLLTYPKTGGDAVERQIKSTLDNSMTDTSVVTAGAANDKIETRQDKFIKASDRIVMTYSDTDGVPYGRAIYDATDNQWSNGVVTAQTLNDAVVAAVNSELTQVADGWQINTEPQTLTFADTNPQFSVSSKMVKIYKNWRMTSTSPIEMSAGMLGKYPVMYGKMILDVPANKVCSSVPPPSNCAQRGCVTNQDTSWDYTVPGTYTLYYYCPTVFGTFVYTGENVEVTTSGSGSDIACDPKCGNTDLWPTIFGLAGVHK